MDTLTKANYELLAIMIKQLYLTPNLLMSKINPRPVLDKTGLGRGVDD